MRSRRISVRDGRWAAEHKRRINFGRPGVDRRSRRTWRLWYAYRPNWHQRTGCRWPTSKKREDGDARFARRGSPACGSPLRRQDRARDRRAKLQLSRARRSVERARREPGQAWRQARRPRDALCAQLLGVDRQLLRRAQDRRGDQSDQRDADAGRGRLCDQGLRSERADRRRRQGRALRSRRASAGLTAIVFGDARRRRGHAVQRARRQARSRSSRSRSNPTRCRPSATRRAPPATRRARCNPIGP